MNLIENVVGMSDSYKIAELLCLGLARMLERARTGSSSYYACSYSCHVCYCSDSSGYYSYYGGYCGYHVGYFSLYVDCMCTMLAVIFYTWSIAITIGPTKGPATKAIF